MSDKKTILRKAATYSFNVRQKQHPCPYATVDTKPSKTKQSGAFFA